MFPVAVQTVAVVPEQEAVQLATPGVADP
jgi:hypothetical protein